MAKVHNEEFRREAVRIALTSGQSRGQVAADLGVGFSMLAKWIQKSRPGDLPPKADIDLTKENERLRRENRLLTEERKLLKKATVFSQVKANEICFR
jgi:transposase